MSKVVVIGSFVVDLMARSPHLPTLGETVKGSMFKMGPGGKGFNQCVAAHKAGAKATIIKKLGKDSFADVVLNAMNELGMPRDYLFFSGEEETGIPLILVDEKTSQNEIIIVPGACNKIVAAISVQRLGTTPSMPSRLEIDEFLEAHKPEEVTTC